MAPYSRVYIQTPKKTSHCRYKRRKYSAAPTKSVAI